ncbi:M20 family metallopeptidase [Paenibacillus flagellatus]|uniref:Amidohydrolase n=1 Tax=Paenibacillus flagellatus TaxID=2211139 RepID=A0A2V5K4Y8_9BACL|nr:M20 family metallopeptidase [Paenibacillus flagellatus]PYI54399.1 amidohydrolase [Paenibacillus flagellatus]
MDKTVEALSRLYPDMVRWRRHLHRYPELSYGERQTSAFVADLLTQWGLDVRTNVGGYGIVATVRGGEGPTVALRADMDALPIQDEKTCEYASTVPGVMHACGHDAHTSALLAVANVFAANKGDLRGSVRFLFQPAEEISPGGAAPMIADGAMDGVDAVYGVHLWTPFPAGTVYSRPGPLMAAADEFVIQIRGKGGHGGLPHETVDSIVVASHLVVNLQTIASRSVDPVEPCVVSVGKLQAGNGFNVIAESAYLNGTVRSFSVETRDRIVERMKRICESTGDLFGADIELDYKVGYPPVVNDAAESERFSRVAGRLFGSERVRQSPLIMAGEDFAYYLHRAPGCFMFVGAGNAEAGIDAPHHHPKFDIDETSMLQSAALLASMAEDFLNGGG